MNSNPSSNHPSQKSRVTLPHQITDEFPDAKAVAWYDPEYLGYVIDYGAYKVVLESLDELNEPGVISAIKDKLRNAK